MTTLDTALAVPPAGAGPRAYVRTAPAQSLAPPRTHVGWLGWAREHLFASPSEHGADDPDRRRCSC